MKSLVCHSGAATLLLLLSAPRHRTVACGAAPEGMAHECNLPLGHDGLHQGDAGPSTFLLWGPGQSPTLKSVSLP